MKLVVAEKPSVMRDIAAVLGAAQKTADGALCGNGYIVTSARGHLVRLKQPDEYNEGYKVVAFRPAYYAGFSVRPDRECGFGSENACPADEQFQNRRDYRSNRRRT